MKTVCVINLYNVHTVAKKMGFGEMRREECIFTIGLGDLTI